MEGVTKIRIKNLPGIWIWKYQIIEEVVSVNTGHVNCLSAYKQE